MTRAPASVVIFDADDTLWDTQPLYEASKRKFFGKMQSLGFAIEVVRPRFEEIDRKNVARFGFSKKRFPRSMQDTYEAFCVEHTRVRDRKLAAELHLVGTEVFAAPPRIFGGVKKVLSYLRRHEVRVVLATKGDKKVQEMRMNASGLRPYFDRIYVLSKKGIPEFKQLLRSERIQPSQGWSVGN